MVFQPDLMGPRLNAGGHGVIAMNSDQASQSIFYFRQFERQCCTNALPGKWKT